MTDEPPPRSGVITPGRVIAVAAGYLVLVWAAIYVIDVAGAAGITERLPAPLWVVLFHESYLTELLQWSALGAAALVAGHLGGRLRDEGDRRLGVFWTLLAAGLMLMLIEDAGNPRHALGGFVERTLAIPGFTVNMVVLGAIALVLLYALGAHWRRVWALRPLRGYLLAAYAVYGMAGLLSGSGPLWYHRVGGRLDELLFGSRLPEADMVAGSQEFLIMDLMVEESVELVGAALFLAAVVAFARSRQIRDLEPAETPPVPAPTP